MDMLNSRMRMGSRTPESHALGASVNNLISCIQPRFEVLSLIRLKVLYQF